MGTSDRNELWLDPAQPWFWRSAPCYRNPPGGLNLPRSTPFRSTVFCAETSPASSVVRGWLLHGTPAAGSYLLLGVDFGGASGARQAGFYVDAVGSTPAIERPVVAVAHNCCEKLRYRLVTGRSAGVKQESPRSP